MNKRKMFLSILGMIFLIGIVTSISLGINKDVTVNENTSIVINNINNEPVERGDIICNERTCTQYMWKGDYNLGYETIDRYKCEIYEKQTDDDGLIFEICISEKLLKDDKIVEELTKRQEKKLEEVAKVITKRQEQELKIIIIDNGEIILSTE